MDSVAVVKPFEIYGKPLLKEGLETRLKITLLAENQTRNDTALLPEDFILTNGLVRVMAE